MTTSITGWMEGLFEQPFEGHVADDGTRSVGGAIQLVYAGPVARTYQFASEADPTCLWVIIDDDEGHALPIPTLNKVGAIEASGKRIKIELRVGGSAYVGNVASWIDKPAHYNWHVGGSGAISFKLQPGTSQTVYQSDTTPKVFRFTTEGFPTGIWVGTETPNVLYPVPTQPTAIDIGGKILTITSKSDQARVVAALDVT